MLKNGTRQMTKKKKKSKETPLMISCSTSQNRVKHKGLNPLFQSRVVEVRCH